MLLGRLAIVHNQKLRVISKDKEWVTNCKTFYGFLTANWKS